MLSDRYPPEAIREAFADAQRTFDGLFPDVRPIFVIGAARSGTTIVGDALRLGAGIPGFHEGFLFSTAYLLLSALDERWSVISSGVEHFRRDGAESRLSRRALVRFDYDALRCHVLRHFHELSTADGETVWVDKTPDVYMLHAMPILSAAYPQARIVFVRRSGIDVVRSRMRTHPEMTFEESCRDWASIMLGWHAIRGHLGSRAIEIDQHRLAADPERVATRLAERLEFDDEQRAGLVRVFTTRFPARTKEGSLASPTLLGDTDWPEEQQAVFREVCTAAMDAFGYVF